jgi:hypothetical protein
VIYLWLSLAVFVVGFFAFPWILLIYKGRSAFSWQLWILIRIAIPQIRSFARKRCIGVGVSWFGAIGIDPRYLTIVVKTDKDWERHSLDADPTFRQDIRKALSRRKYPVDSIPQVQVMIQSQETVDRDMGGNWFYAMQ